LIIILILLLLFVSIGCHIYYLFGFIKSRSDKDFRRFINTTVFNLFLGGFCIIIAIFWPDQIRKVRGPAVIWFLSGVILFITLFLQISIFIRVYNRTQLPENYHYNFFGKKVYHPSVVKSIEVVLFFSSVPLFLIAGSYFVARFIRIFV
jgi:hypothetical protein